MPDDGLKNGSKELLKILLNFLEMSCGDAKQSLLTNAYLLGDDKVKYNQWHSKLNN